MKKEIQSQDLIAFGLKKKLANTLTKKINFYLKYPAEKAWQNISKKVLHPKLPFNLHLFVFNFLFPHWKEKLGWAPVWIPDEKFIKTTNLFRFMKKLKITKFQKFHEWSVRNFEKFWEKIIKQLGIVFKKRHNKICDLSEGVESPNWLVGAKLNIADSCFTANPKKTAIIFKNAKTPIRKMSYGALDRLSNRVANSLVQLGFHPGDSIAIDMPMNEYAVAIYFGIIKMGGVVVSIADSFSKDEIMTRLRLAKTKAIFTQDFILREGKKIPLYQKIVDANAPPAFVLPSEKKITCPLRKEDKDWNSFLVANDKFITYPCDPMAPCNILFSSGTTGEPKAIPWTHSTPIKVASDAFFHQDIRSKDIFAWPTNLGWMMGPWLIFAALINRASIALYDGVPREKGFGKFIQDAKVTLLGVVPTLVASWKQNNSLEKLNWKSIKAFSSTGESSNPEDMFYLMSRAGYKPIIEYCGGTEIGGSYITSTIIDKNFPSVFTTPALGIDFVLLDESGKVTNNGEVALIPPSIGLSTTLLNGDHYKTYFSNMPKTPEGKILRRHGDQICKVENNYFSILGRVDDTMNLGGIKVSSAELERVLKNVEGITEVAAIAVNPQGQGPSRLVIYATTVGNLEKEVVLTNMQKNINQHLNPLFKIYDVVFISELPKTASNKIMRKELRKAYQEKFLK